MMKKLFAILLIISAGLVACTVSPKHVEGDRPAFDSSTPAQYSPYNNGYLGQVLVAGDTARSGLLTPNGRRDYNAFIGKWAVQYEARYTRKLAPDIGIRPYVDQFGNSLFVIDKEHLKDFMTLCQWSRDNRPADTLFQRLIP